MSDRTIVVAGATGGVGEGAVRSFLEQGHRVLALGRSRQRLGQMRQGLESPPGDQLVLLECDVTSTDSTAVTGLVETAAGGPVSGALIAIGVTPAPNPGTLLDIPDDEIESAIAVNEIGGLRALRALTPCIEPAGAVVNLLGYSGEIPFPNNPLMGSTNAALRSMLTTLAVQLADRGPRVYALTIGVVRTRARQHAGIDNPGWLTGHQIGTYAAALIDGTVERPEQTIRYLLSPAGPTLTPPRAR